MDNRRWRSQARTVGRGVGRDRTKSTRYEIESSEFTELHGGVQLRETVGYNGVVFKQCSWHDVGLRRGSMLKETNLSPTKLEGGKCIVDAFP